MTRKHDDLLRSVSRSFYLSMRFLPAAMREPISLGYLLARFTDTIADAPGIPAETRLSWLEQTKQVVRGERLSLEVKEGQIEAALAHPGERELVQRRDELFDWFREIDEANRSHLSEVILTIAHGQTWDVTFFEDETLTAPDRADDLFRYTYWVAGCVGEFWTKVGYTTLGQGFADPDQAFAMLQSGRKLGQGLQLVNILRDLHEDLPEGRCYLPGGELRDAGWNGSGIPDLEQVAPVFEHWLSVCEGFLEEADGYTREVRNARVRFCTKLPKILAERTVRRMREAGPDRVLREKVKVSRREVWAAMLQAVFC